jgi:hypothetical protein
MSLKQNVSRTTRRKRQISIAVGVLTGFLATSRTSIVRIHKQ